MKILTVCLLIFLMLFIVTGLLAQDDDDSATPTPEVIVLADDAVTVIAEIAIAPSEALPTELLTIEQSDELTSALGRSLGLGILAGAPLVLILTQGTKFISYADRFKAENIALVWSAVIVIAGSVAFNSGYGDLFDSSYNALSGLAIPFVTGLTAFTGAGLGYNKLIKPATGDKMGILSKARTPGA